MRDAVKHSAFFVGGYRKWRKFDFVVWWVVLVLNHNLRLKSYK